MITDEEADRLAREMIPMLKKGEYGNALLHLAKSVSEEIQQKVDR